MVSPTIANDSSQGKSASARLDALCYLTLAVIAACAFLPCLGSAGMFDPTDSFFIESGREMLETHKFIVPLMNYEQWLDKPALDFCLIALSLKLFGVNEFAGRLPAALSGILECLLLFACSRQLLTRRQAFLSALVLLASPLFIIVGRTSLSDEPLSLFLTTSLLSFALASIKKSKLFLVPAYIGLGLAILLKGPPLALILTGLVLTGYLLLTERLKFFSAAFQLQPIGGLLAAAAIALPYYLWAHIGTGGEFTTNFFLRQNLGRAAGTVNHVRPFWWYAPILFLGVFPWSIALLASYRFLKKVLLIAPEHCTRRQKLEKFACCWAVLGFLFFSAVPTKLETYIVPILPAIAILSGCFLDLLLRARQSKLSRAVLSICLVLAATMVVASPVVIKLTLDKQGAFVPVQIVACVALLAGCAFGFFKLRKRQLEASTYALLGTTIAYFAVFIPLLFVVYHKSYQEPVDKLISYAHSQHADLAVLYFSMPSAMFRYQRAIPLIKSKEEMHAYADGAPDKRWVLINPEALDLLDWTERSPRVVAHEGKWWLFAVGKNCTKENTVEWNGVSKGGYPTLADRKVR